MNKNACVNQSTSHNDRDRQKASVDLKVELMKLVLTVPEHLNVIGVTQRQSQECTLLISGMQQPLNKGTLTVMQEMTDKSRGSDCNYLRVRYCVDVCIYVFTLTVVSPIKDYFST